MEIDNEITPPLAKNPGYATASMVRLCDSDFSSLCLLKCINSVLAVSKVCLFLCAHSFAMVTALDSLDRFSFIVGVDTNTLISSANEEVGINFFSSKIKSAVNRIKRIAEIGDPCGRPC